MSLNVNVLAAKVVAVGVTTANAVTIVNEAISLIGVVENVYVGLKGEVKFQAVMSAMDAVIAQLGLTDKLAQIKKVLAPLVNLIVAILNGASLWGSVFGSLLSGVESVLKPAVPVSPPPAPAAAS